MSKEEIEPDAYSFDRYFKMKTDSETAYASEHPDEWIDEVEVDLSIIPESIDPLFSAEKIQKQLKQILLSEIPVFEDEEKGETEMLHQVMEQVREVFSSDEQ